MRVAEPPHSASDIRLPLSGLTTDRDRIHQGRRRLCTPYAHAGASQIGSSATGETTEDRRAPLRIDEVRKTPILGACISDAAHKPRRCFAPTLTIAMARERNYVLRCHSGLEDHACETGLRMTQLAPDPVEEAIVATLRVVRDDGRYATEFEFYPDEIIGIVAAGASKVRDLVRNTSDNRLPRFLESSGTCPANLEEVRIVSAAEILRRIRGLKDSWPERDNGFPQELLNEKETREDDAWCGSISHPHWLDAVQVLIHVSRVGALAGTRQDRFDLVARLRSGLECIPEAHSPATGSPPPQRYGISAEGAELLARDWMRFFGAPSAEVTQAIGKDGGKDVVSLSHVAEMKHRLERTGVESIRELYGVAVSERKGALFFSKSGYTPDALAFGNLIDMPLLQHDAGAGTLHGVNAAGRRYVSSRTAVSEGVEPSRLDRTREASPAKRLTIAGRPVSGRWRVTTSAGKIFVADLNERTIQFNSEAGEAPSAPLKFVRLERLNVGDRVEFWFVDHGLKRRTLHETVRGVTHFS